MATLGELKATIRELLNEPTAVRFSDSLVKGWINDACNEVNLRIQYAVRTAVYHTVAGTASITIDPKTMLYLLRLSYDGKYLPPATKDLADYIATDQTTQGTPKLWYTQEDAIWFVPVPDSIKVVRIDYVLKAGYLVNDADNCVFPDFFNKAIIFYVLHWAALMDKEWTEADRYLALFENAIKDIRKTEALNPALIIAPLPDGLLRGSGLYHAKLPDNYPDV